jgi:hypothetical protein
VRLKHQRAATRQRRTGFGEYRPRLLRSERVELAMDEHDQTIPLAILYAAHVLLKVRAAETIAPCLFASVPHRSRAKVDSDAFVPELCQPARIQARTTPQIENPSRLTLQDLMVQPGDMAIDHLYPTASRVM